MNFIEEFKKGQLDGNKGLPMGDGLINISNVINGVQKGRLFGIAGAPKSGKSTFVDYAFFLQPYLYSLENNISVEWIYYSFEIDRISKEFDIAAFFLYNDYKIKNIALEGTTKNGKTYLPLSSDYLRGRVLDDKHKVIKVKQSVIDVLKEVYKKRIIPIFGEYNKAGVLTTPGVVTFIEQKNNPTGIFKYLKDRAEQNGKFITTNDKKYSRITGYKADNPKKYTIVITDHIRKILMERGWAMKQSIDKLIEFQVEIRNLTGYIFVDIIHTNRDMISQSRLGFFKDMLYPTADFIKDTGNLAEDADYVFTIMNPNDDRYNLKSHFGMKIKDSNNNDLYPNLRTVHLVESRHCEYPQHFKINMIANCKNFEQLNIK